jgi:hypothetical protein
MRLVFLNMIGCLFLLKVETPPAISENVSFLPVELYQNP